MVGLLTDALGRQVQDLRISVTDRCNFRCGYCMPPDVFAKQHRFLPAPSILNFEEITRVAQLWVAHGVQKIRLTGGEPLLRKDLRVLVRLLSELRTPKGEPLELALTTNGALLAGQAHALKQAGLHRVTVSLDALDDDCFRAITNAKVSVKNILNGIEVAQQAGLAPVKVNMVVKRGWNESQILPMARHFKNTPIVLRFIEFMDVGSTNGWQRGSVFPSAQVVQIIHAQWPLERLKPRWPGETAERWRYQDGSGEVGLISSVTKPFCGSCTRARLSTEGQLFTCLFATQGHDLRQLLRGGCTDQELAQAMGLIWQARSDRYSELRGTAPSTRADVQRIEMHYIGG
jgi:GTP 3',8-cyclase